MLSPAVRELVDCLSAHAQPENAAKMNAYFKQQFEFLGIRKPELAALTKTWVKERGARRTDDLPELIQELWSLPGREYQYVALLLLTRQARYLRREDIEWLEALVVRQSWWDSVDPLAADVLGAYFRNFPETIAPYTEKWIRSDPMWLRRTALLFQLKYKERTDWGRLTDYVLLCADERPFFIRKAIGWALREYGKTNPDAVVRFVREHKDKLSPLSSREALKNIP